MLQVLQALHHPNVVSCKEAFVTGGKLCILMDYCSEGYCKPESSSRTAPYYRYIRLSLTSCLICGLACNVAGDLANALKKRNGAVLPEAVLLDWFVQLCLGLKHVHDRKILHR